MAPKVKPEGTSGRRRPTKLPAVPSAGLDGPAKTSPSKGGGWSKWLTDKLGVNSSAEYNGGRKYSLEQSLERSIRDHRRSITDIAGVNKGGKQGTGMDDKRLSLTVNPLDDTTVMRDDKEHWMMFRPTSMKRLTWDIVMIVRVFKMLRITKIVRFLKGSLFAEQFDDWIHMSASRHTLRMSKLLVGTILASHVNCCIWAGVGNSNDDNNWLDHYVSEDSGFERDNAGSVYLGAMYWSIQTMTTVGYGDILPQNDAERAYSIFSMLLGGGYYGFIVATMASLVSNLDANAKSYYEKMDNVTSYMKKRKFPKVLFRKMRKYYKHYFEQRTALNESEILDDLSSQLRTEVALFLIHDIVYNIDLFHDLTPEMLAKLLTVLKPLQAGHKEVLSVAGQIGREMYIIISGEMVLQKPDKDDDDTTILTAGEYFGELCVLDINPINLTTITARGTCELYSLSRDDVFNIFKEMPEVLDHMKDIALEAFIVNHKLDADVDEEDEVLNEFFEQKNKIAVNSKSSEAKEGASSRKTLKTKRSSLALTEASQTKREDNGGGEGGGEGTRAKRESFASKRRTMDAKRLAAARSDILDNSGVVSSLTVDTGASSVATSPAYASSHIDNRMRSLENKLDKLLSSISNVSPNGSGGGHQGMSAARVMRQQALKEEHELHQRTSPKRGLQRVGSKADISEDIARDAQAAIQHRRQSRMLGMELASSLTDGGAAGGGGGGGGGGSIANNLSSVGEGVNKAS
ncbi:hypothetical protein TrRE_jg6226 [Triparma retinervis]|uniref:Cyclic nucleotide-binding domain-containing protein n=1 Tax=Triparma retinervis TaxID=2557542 RepID=A0A9W7G4V3_9STRA|nr:hypothetical protein TrRE_jg6226 [Triparma retinervis]